MSNASPAASSSVEPTRRKAPCSAHVEQQRVASACKQAEERRLHRLGLEVERGDMPVQVVDRHERQAAGPRERLGRGEADEQRADQAGPGGDRDAVDVVERDARLLLRLTQDRQHELEVPARGDLGDDAAVARMQVGLGGDDVGPDLALLGDERGGRLVAGRLERENHASIMPGSDELAAGAGQALAASRTGSFHMISASSRLSV